MTKVFCIGDSIRMQYAPRVKEMLKEEFSVDAPAENCRFAKYSLRGLYDWRAGLEGCDIVHWNNGLWDVCDIFGDGVFTSEEEYATTMLRIADLLLKEHEIVIFATTTPVSKRNQHNTNETIARYNRMIVPLLEAKGVLINDLYTPVAADINRYISEDTIHLSEEGIALCAAQVADAIRKAAGLLSGEAPKVAKAAKETMGAPVKFQ